MPIEKPLHANFHCRHYSYEGGMKGGPRCAAGVDMTAPGSTRPCMPLDGKAPACDKREEFTQPEREAWAAYRADSMIRMSKIMPLVPGSSRDRKNRPEWGKRGSFDCPGCGEGAVHWSRSPYNGHVHAACTTPNCFAVME